MSLKHCLLTCLVVISGITSCNKKTSPVSESTPVDSTKSKPPLVNIIDDVEEAGFFSGFSTYLIKKGKNYCENNSYLSMLGKNELRFQVVFDSSCIYTNTQPENQADINKLLGFSDCETHHQENSARFGWNWMEGQLYIYAYCYRNKERQYKTLGSVSLNQKQYCRLSVSDNYYIFELNGKSDTMPRHCTDSLVKGYQLLPYFGGDETAPHDVYIRIKHL